MDLVPCDGVNRWLRLVLQKGLLCTNERLLLLDHFCHFNLQLNWCHWFLVGDGSHRKLNFQGEPTRAHASEVFCFTWRDVNTDFFLKPCYAYSIFVIFYTDKILVSKIYTKNNWKYLKNIPDLKFIFENHLKPGLSRPGGPNSETRGLHFNYLDPESVVQILRP